MEMMTFDTSFKKVTQAFMKTKETTVYAFCHIVSVAWPYLRGVSLESKLPVFIVMVSVNSTSLAGEASASL